MALGPVVVAVCVATTGALGVGIGLASALLNARRRNSPTVTLVRNRKRLWRQLRTLIGDDFEASKLLQSEARRLGVQGASLEALNAAITRAKALADTRLA